jgi:hypothetical protein
MVIVVTNLDNVIYLVPSRRMTSFIRRHRQTKQGVI